MEGEGIPVNNRPVGFTSSGPVLEQVTNYTIPGILHFIKHEWSRFEKERASWEVERAELQVQITLGLAKSTIGKAVSLAKPTTNQLGACYHRNKLTGCFLGRRVCLISSNCQVFRLSLQAKIAFLQGERRGYENLMRDLVRRIKMLEYALKQER